MPDTPPGVAAAAPAAQAAAAQGAPAVAGNPLPQGVSGQYPGDAAILRQVPVSPNNKWDPVTKDLSKGLADCASSVEDLINIMDGKSTVGGTLTTGTAADLLPKLGFTLVDKPVAGAFNIGVDDTPAPGVPKHMQATLPGGTHFNWGSTSSAQKGGQAGSQGAYDPRFQTTGKIYARMPGAVNLSPTLNPERFGPLTSITDPITDAINNAPGNPGQQPLKTEITNLPKQGQQGRSGSPLAAESGYGGQTLAEAIDPSTLSLPADDLGSHPQILAAGAIAKAMGLQFTSGVENHVDDGGWHPKGQAGDFSNVGGWTATFADNTPQMEAFAKGMLGNFSQFIEELIYYSPTMSKQIASGQVVDTNSGAYSLDTLKGHTNHVHLAIKDGMEEMFLSAVQKSLGGNPVPLDNTDKLTVNKGAGEIDPNTGEYGVWKTDDLTIMQAEDALTTLGDRVKELTDDIAAYQVAIANGADYQEQLNDANKELEQLTRPGGDIAQQKLKVAQARKGTWEKLDTPGSKKGKDFNIDDLPFGDPRKILGAMIMGAGGTQADVAALLGTQNIGQAAAAAAQVEIPGPMGPTGTPTAPDTETKKLLEERNPMVGAKLLGIPVPDYTREGGDKGEVQQGNTAPGAGGQVMSDTAAMIDRSFANQEAVNKARHDQVVGVLNEIKAKLIGEVAPAVSEGVTKGLNGAAAEIGNKLGEAAGPKIADAVAAAIPKDGGQQQPAAAPLPLPVPGMAYGGPITGGTAGKDSVPALLMPGEWVFTTQEVARMGGFGGVERFRAALLAGKVRGYASGGAVVTGNPNGGRDVSSSVGADFFGVSQIPILAQAINLLVAVLLKVIDVQIMSRDSMIEVSKDFKEFRGDFQAFDAYGRLKNDTAGLTDRTSSSEKQAADERIRIFKAVMDGIVKYVIERIIVPLSKAIANAIVQAGTGALTAGLGAAFPGGSIVGQIVGSVVSAAADVAIELWSEIFTIAAETAFSVGMEVVGEALQTLFPKLATGLLSGALAEGLFGPISQWIINYTGAVTTLFNNFTALFSGLGQLGGTLSGLLAGFGLFTNLLGGVVGSLGGVSAVLNLIWVGLSNLAGNIGAALGNVLSNLWGWLQSLFGTLLSGLQSLFGNFVPVLQNVFGNLGAMLQTLFGNLVLMLQNVFGNLGAMLSNVFGNLPTLLGNAFGALVGTLQRIADLLVAIWTSITNFGPGLQNVLSGFAPILSNLSNVTGGLQGIATLINTVLTKFNVMVPNLNLAAASVGVSSAAVTTALAGITSMFANTSTTAAPIQSITTNANSLIGNLLNVLTAGKTTTTSTSSTTVTAPITVTATNAVQTAETIANRLLALVS